MTNHIAKHVNLSIFLLGVIYMISLNELKPDIHYIISDISKQEGIDMAVIDNNYNLITSTDAYLKYKGNSVYPPFINEAIAKGQVLCINPGHMFLCDGCRFQNNCPAKVEILNSINTSNSCLGVISLTAFNKKTENLISKNPDPFFKLLDYISLKISSVISQKEIKYQRESFNALLKTAMSMSSSGILSIDKNGKITNYNDYIEQILKIKNLKGKSIKSIIKPDIVENILNGDSISNQLVQRTNQNLMLSSNSIVINNDFSGAVIKVDMLNSRCDDKIVVPSNCASNKFLDNIIGHSTPVIALKNKISTIANSKSTVLIIGETGTGKDLVAKSLHHCSTRKNSPFIPVNCAGIPENLFESELFGYEEGSFTGARKNGKPGYFELADGGTLFLDEIGEIPYHLQSKLLRVLQEHEVMRIGSSHSNKIDVRIVAATNKPLEKMIKEKTFREDLYYRLKVLCLEIPPLRMRENDIEELSTFFLKKYNEILDKNILGFTNEAISLLHSHIWPGNIRELENAIECAINLEISEYITVNSLPEYLQNGEKLIAVSLKEQVNVLEAQLIRNALDKYGWDLLGKEKAAQELKIGLRTLYRKIEEYKL